MVGGGGSKWQTRGGGAGSREVKSSTANGEQRKRELKVGRVIYSGSPFPVLHRLRQHPHRGLSVPASEPTGDISHSNHHCQNKNGVAGSTLIENC